MELAKKIDQNFIEAMKNKGMELPVLRMLRAALKNKSIELRRELAEADILAVLRGEIKKRKDSAEAYEQGGRQDLKDNEVKEIQILQKYLPAELSADALARRVGQIVSGLPEEDKANFGKAMAAVMAELKGAAGGAAVAEAVKKVLSL